MKKTKSILAGVVAFAGATSPITTLAYTNADNSTTYSSNIENLNARGVQTGYYDATTAINFRKTASWSGTVISTISKGTTVYVSSVSNGWAKIEHNNTTGYVPAEYLTAVSKKETVTTSVNLRKTASWSGDIIQVIKAGEAVHTEGTSGEFSKVLYNGKTGYIPTKYITSSTNSGSGSSSSSINHGTGSKTVTEAVNLRETASWSGTIIQTIKAGESVTVVSTSGDWTKVTYNNKTGYVPTSYLSNSLNNSNNSNNSSNSGVTAMSATGKVVNLTSGDTLNIRKEANNTSSASLGKLSAGATVSITGRHKESGWYQINYNGQTGYVSDYYIEIVNQSTSTTYKKTTANLNMRSGPSTSHSIITEIPSGTSVTVLSSSNGWDYVEYDGQKGYCSSSYLVATNEVPTVKKVTTANLNMRTGAGTNYSIITTIPNNTVVDVISTSNGWSKIKYNGKEGYVSASYLAAYTGNSSNTGGGSLPPSKPSYANKTIVIDPGHGGKDPGAVAFGRNEKDIALNISKKINANLKTLGFKTVMTRTTDVYITLADRYTIANNNNASLFVSVHLNSASSSSANGIETLYKNSKAFASGIQNELISATGATNRGVKQRTDLAVLNGTKMPASLVEVGFISHSAESAKLDTNSYQDTLANSIAKGIAKYTDSSL